MHSGADLQSAAASVLGYDQVSMKGKAIKVAPVPEVATPKLKALLGAVLPSADEAAEAGLQGKAGAGGVTQTLMQVGDLMAVRRVLLPALARGDKGCGGRLRYGINGFSTSCHLNPIFYWHLGLVICKAAGKHSMELHSLQQPVTSLANRQCLSDHPTVI